ncbi:MAG: sugar phosphate isomerase/epimerase [Verrucomicrobia bacterium]|nr:sugar phosphate isomerase/epimerase [Verrucomicrobiota bacterium]
MVTSRTSRRHFLGAIGAAVASFGTRRMFGAEAARDNIHLGMMLQADSAVELHKNAKAIAAAGFDTVQVTFFFPPTADELKSLASALKELKLKTAAFGTYFNLFRPEETGFMRSSIATMKLVAEHAGLFDCKQFITWSASYSPKFTGADPRNHTPEAVAHLQRAIREIILPVLEPIDGRVAFEPFYLHVVGTLALAKEVFAPFPASRVGLVLDPPGFIPLDLYRKRDEEMCRLFRELGDRVHLAHFKDIKLNAAGNGLVKPGPGNGEMNYPLLISEIRKLHRPLSCIIEHIKAEPAEMSKTKAWVEKQLKVGS